MKIVDFKKKGNIVRFYLGTDKQSAESWGDDWDDAPYDCNAGIVYDEYIDHTIDVVFPFDWVVLEPCNDWHFTNCRYAKEDMKNRYVPAIIAVPSYLSEDSFIDDSFSYWCSNDKVFKFFFGDELYADKDVKTALFDIDNKLIEIKNRFVIGE